MKKFMVLYMASGAQFEKMMKSSTPEQQKKGMEAWMKWMDANKASLVDGGAPLGKTKRVDQSGASNIKNELGGYSIVQAKSHDAAAKNLRPWPPAPADAWRMDRDRRDHVAAGNVARRAGSRCEAREHRQIAQSRFRARPVSGL